MSEEQAVEKPEAKSAKMFVCTPEEWAQLTQLMGAVPASVAAGAYVWMTQKQPVDVSL